MNFQNIQKIIFAPPIKKSVGDVPPKLAGRRIKLKDKEYMQFEHIKDNQAFHENIAIENLPDFFERKILDYKQANIFLEDAHYKAFNKNGAVKFHKSKNTGTHSVHTQNHNRRKNYIINEGDNIPALVELGIFTKDFKIINSMYSKFKQINRFVELFNDLSAQIDEIYAKHGRINIIDFGCGKSYLTFILYYYFINVKKIPEQDLNITGVDLKKSAVDDCNNLARKYNYISLNFKLGDIKDYAPDNNINIVVSLHGCDLATDYALYNAIKWRAGIIFAAPCCEHEINAQAITGMRNILKYGAVKERFAAMLTNAVRCNLLELQSYRTELLEFVDISHSPKNLLIRAVSISGANVKHEQIKRELEQTLADFGVSQTLYNLLHS